MPRVSIVIPTRNAGAAFERALEAIADQDLDEPYEVVVIDSGSTDGTPELARRHGARVMAIDPATFGHGRTRNAAIAACEGELVALTVQDAVPADSGWLSYLVGELRTNDRAAGAFSASIPGTELGPIARVLAEERCQHLGTDRVEHTLPSPSAFQALPFEDRSRICTLDNVSSIIRRSVWERIPFRDLRFAEDVAWAHDVLHAGHSITFVPESRVYHAHDRSPHYHLRRHYIEAMIVGEILGEPPRPLGALMVLHLCLMWRRAERRGCPDDGMLISVGRYAKALQSAKVADGEACRQRFGAEALNQLIGPRSRCTLTEQLGMLYHMDLHYEQACHRSDQGLPRRGSLGNVVGRLLARPDVGVLAGTTLGLWHALDHNDYRCLFDALWHSPYRELALRATAAADRDIERPHSMPSIARQIRRRACELAAKASRYSDLSRSLCDLSCRFAAAEVLGRRIGSGMRGRTGQSWRRAVHERLLRGV